MLRNLNSILGYTLSCTDGEIGKAKDFLFDDDQWVIRYMVADTAKWLPGRKVLLSPVSFGAPDWKTETFPMSISRDQVKESPPLEENMPVSREYEVSFFDYYGYPYYWVGDWGYWGLSNRPYDLSQKSVEDIKDATNPAATDATETGLRSAKEVNGYNINALDKEIGHVEDFIVDDDTWVIRYIVVDTRNWLPGGKKVLLARNWITGVSWAHHKVDVNMQSDEVKESPEFNPHTPVNRSYEIQLYDFYGRPYYW